MLNSKQSYAYCLIVTVGEKLWFGEVEYTISIIQENKKISGKQENLSFTIWINIR